MLNKKALVAEILARLKNDLANNMAAAEQAHKASTDEESIAETQYDTLAIEAAYLAEGRSRRVLEIQSAIKAYQKLKLIKFDLDTQIAPGALVQLSQDKNRNHWYFIGPAAGGQKLSQDNTQVTVITPQSPLGQSLIGKYQDDDLQLQIADRKLTDYISSVF